MVSPSSVHRSKARASREQISRPLAAANNAKAGCPVSKVLKAEITMNASLSLTFTWGQRTNS
jgi:organic hydroperoxide reductase OsmC/OhrA